MVRRWIDIHHVDEAGATQDEIDGQTRMSLLDSSGAVVVEHYAIDGIYAMFNWIRRTERLEALNDVTKP